MQLGTGLPARARDRRARDEGVIRNWPEVGRSGETLRAEEERFQTTLKLGSSGCIEAVERCPRQGPDPFRCRRSLYEPTGCRSM